MSVHAKEQPRVSVITINFNDAPHLTKTIKSVQEQDYPHLEYLIIDGGSTDESLSIIKTHEKSINRWVSEKDQGIFDAMNKGVAMATGEYINFMNAGDWFLSNNVISQVFDQEQSSKADLVYGNHEVHYPGFIKKKTGMPVHNLWKHMAFSHQTLFTKRIILLANPFDLSFKIAADFHFIFNCYQAGKVFHNTEADIAGYLAGGQSEMQVIKAYLENKRIVFAHHPTLKVKLFHYGLLLKQLPLVALRMLIPEKYFQALMKWKNGLSK